jgi:hypothetical protein
LHRLRRKPHRHDIEDVEELRAKLHADEFRSALSLAEGGVLDKGEDSFLSFLKSSSASYYLSSMGSSTRQREHE